MTLTESRATIIFTKTWTHLNASTVRFLKRNSPHLCARPSIRSMYKPFDTISKDRSVRRQCGPTSESRTENLLRLVLRRYVCRSLDSTRDSVRAEIKQRNRRVVPLPLSRKTPARCHRGRLGLVSVSSRFGRPRVARREQDDENETNTPPGTPDRHGFVSTGSSVHTPRQTAVLDDAGRWQIRPNRHRKTSEAIRRPYTDSRNSKSADISRYSDGDENGGRNSEIRIVGGIPRIRTGSVDLRVKTVGRNVPVTSRWKNPCRRSFARRIITKKPRLQIEELAEFQTAKAWDGSCRQSNAINFNVTLLTLRLCNSVSEENV